MFAREGFVVLTVAQVRELLAEVELMASDAFIEGTKVGFADAKEGEAMNAKDAFDGGYDQGYEDGHADGYYDGGQEFDQGVSEGYDEGYTDGFEEGYAEGREDGELDASLSAAEAAAFEGPLSKD